MLKRLTYSIVFTLILTNILYAQTAMEKKIYKTKRVNPEPPLIDGSLDDLVWDEVEWGGDFIQRRPYEGDAPTQQTAFKVLYDNDNFYIGVRAYDTAPDSIVQHLARRDYFPGDRVEINIDSYFDHRTAFAFTISVSGVKGDELISNDGNGDHQGRDRNWDAVWHAKTAIDDLGWTAEISIPLSQLRFSNLDEQIWGLQIIRRFFRKDEHSVWQFIPQDAPGWVSFFGELHGIKGLKPNCQVEILPYTVGSYRRFEKEPGNPFATGSLQNLSFGLDGKIGITSELTMDFSVNPDFGQVEADPSQVNLTAFETFFQEKRPFFIEGKNIFQFELPNQNILFYSRRIGRQPHLSPDLEGNEFADEPDNTTILGAAKLTGKTKNGLSIGLLESVTAKEEATIDLSGDRRNLVVEPLTNYFVGRLQQDFNKGNTIIGGMATAVHRNINDTELNFLHKSAYTGGLDFQHYWQDKNYFLRGQTAFSHVTGDPEALLETQTASRRYFQRPDADHLSLDSTLTSLSGHSGMISIGKEGGSDFRYEALFMWQSPGLELNDIGFQREADLYFGWASLKYFKLTPFSIFRNLQITTAYWQSWNFGNERLSNNWNLFINGQFKNYWQFRINTDLRGETLSSTALRGGPSLLIPGWLHNSVWLHTDPRKDIRFVFFNRINQSKHDAESIHRFEAGVAYRPLDSFEIMAFPGFTNTKRDFQYVYVDEYEGNEPYILSRINHQTIDLTFRLNLCLSPNLTIQYYGQPFVSQVLSKDFKRVTDPRAKKYADRFRIIDENELTFNADDEIHSVDEDGDGNTDYSFCNPEFNAREFTSNLVVRWEYKPGSTLYFVWSQNRNNSYLTDDFTFGNEMNRLFDVQPHDVFLVKFNHWFSW